MKIRIAVAPAGGQLDSTSYAEFVDELERLRFDTVWLSDVPLGPSVDPIVGLSFAASRTKRLKLGCNLVPIGRNPFVLAKELAQLDRLAQGRLLLSLVPGVDQPGERDVLGIGTTNRGAYMDQVIPLLRAWWAGEEVDHHDAGLNFAFPGVRLPVRPVQDPLEIWLGGRGPLALRRVGRLADGWLGSALSPSEAGEARRTIEEAASAAGRQVDPEHFGLSLAYAREAPDESTLAGLRARRPQSTGADLAALLPIGAEALRESIQQYAEHGISKFVVRGMGGHRPVSEELGWLADTVLSVQT